MPLESTVTVRCDGCRYWLRMLTDTVSRTATNRLSATFFPGEEEATQTAHEQDWLIRGDDFRCPRCQKKGKL